MRILIPLFIIVVGAACSSAQEISVRLLNAKSGKPLPKVALTMFSYNGDVKFERGKSFPKWKTPDETTDSQGRAVFHLPEARPEHINFLVGEPWNFWGCCCRQPLSPESVLRSGEIAQYDEHTCGRLTRHATAQPGEVIIFERKMTFWDRVRQEIP
jgi:hypothetical protein